MTQRQLVSKAVRIAQILESHQGTPRQSRRQENPLDMLIATILSQNTNDLNSHRAYEKLRTQFSTWKRVLEAPVGKIARAIRVGGIANQKSARIKKILQTIQERYGNLSLNALKKKSHEEIISDLLTFDGVGVKTAACVLLFALKRKVFPVDTHIHRICNRLGLVKTNLADKTYEEMKRLVPPEKTYSLHVNLIRFGRSICGAQNPLCGVCPLYDECIYEGRDPLAGLITGTKLREKRHRGLLLPELV